MKQNILSVSQSHRVKSDWFIVLLLGALSLITPFSVDMYLPAFSRIAAEFKTTTSAVSLSLSTYFIGFALGQILYGPPLDRFGRKRPVYASLSLYVLTTFACVHPPNLKSLIALRFLQAIGGCVAQVASVAMVRDFFPPNQSARVFSLLFLIIGVSPLLAPTIGSFITLWLGWPWIFVLLCGFALTILMIVFFFLPEAYQPDPTVSLRLRPMLESFWSVFREPQFFTYALAGAFSFAGLFSYVAGSPLIFMDGFRVSEKAFGGIFAVLTLGFIGGSQVNVFLLRYLKSQHIFSTALTVQFFVGLLFMTGFLLGWYGLTATLILFFLFLSCIGLTYPNAAAIALAPFSRNVGSASALLGFIQMGTGALISTNIGILGVNSVIALLFGSVFLALCLFVVSRHFLGELTPNSENQEASLTH